MVAILGSAAVVMSVELGCGVSGGEAAAAEVEVASCHGGGGAEDVHKDVGENAKGVVKQAALIR